MLEGDLLSYIKGQIEKGVDKEGVYFVMKGDNNDFSDGKVRFSEIRYVTIGLLY